MLVFAEEDNRAQAEHLARRRLAVEVESDVAVVVVAAAPQKNAFRFVM